MRTCEARRPRLDRSRRCVLPAHRVNHESSPSASRQVVPLPLRRDLSRLSRRPAGRVVGSPFDPLFDGLASRSRRWRSVFAESPRAHVRCASTAADALSAVLFDGGGIADGRCGGRSLAGLVINSTKTTRSSNSSFRWPRSDTRCGSAGAVRVCSDLAWSGINACSLRTAADTAPIPAERISARPSPGRSAAINCEPYRRERATPSKQATRPALPPSTRPPTRSP